MDSSDPAPHGIGPETPYLAQDGNFGAGRIGFQRPGAAVLLTHATHRLCENMGEEEASDLDTDVGNLVRKGLDPAMQRAFEIARAAGNEARILGAEGPAQCR
jgi:hypothetical protein